MWHCTTTLSYTYIDYLLMMMMMTVVYMFFTILLIQFPYKSKYVYLIILNAFFARLMWICGKIENKNGVAKNFMLIFLVISFLKCNLKLYLNCCVLKDINKEKHELRT